MSTFTVLIVLIVSAIILFLINKFIAMDGTIRKIFNTIVVVAIFIEILK
ncbi:Thivi_2564 family membrane protein [Flavobacterium sp.]|nr:Thivi_2564 family membrane protein [Flavobacterium sp.]HLF53090.1 Thivi_2564 family membrane protein [Flavobacterium sp.]